MTNKSLLFFIIFSGIFAQANQMHDPLNIDQDAKFQFLAGELALARKNIPEAIHYYDALVKKINDPFIFGRRIDLFFEEGKGGDALDITQLYVSQNPEDIDGLVTLALVYLEKDNEKGAIMVLDKVARIRETQNHASNSYLYLYQGLKDKTEEKRLIRIFQGLASLNPDSVPLLNLTASLMIDNNQIDDAMNYLDRVQIIDPKNILVYSLYAYAYSQNNEVDRALALIKGAAEKDPSLAMNSELLKVLTADFRYDEALLLAQKLNKEYPKDMYLWERLAFLNYVLGNYEEAQKALEIVINHRGDGKNLILSLFKVSTETKSYQAILDIIPVTRDAEISRSVSINKAYLALADKQYDQFLSIFDELRTFYPQNQLYFYLEQMDLLEKNSEYKLLLNMAQLADQIYPENFVIMFYKAMAYYGMKDYVTMEKIFRDWLISNPEDVPAFNSLGYMILETDPQRVDEALALIEKAYQKEPNDSAILDSLGWAYFKKGVFDKAEYYLAMAYNRSKQPEIIAHYIFSLEKQKKNEKAKQIYGMFKKVYPKSIELLELQQQLNWP